MKTLIYMDKKNVVEHGGRGGPLGVGYYILKELEKGRNTDITFLNNDYNEQFEKRNQGIHKSFKDHLPRRLRYLLSIVNKYRVYKTLLDKPGKLEKVDFSAYDAVHFHSTEEMFKVRTSLDNYKGYVLLTSHTPVPAAQERIMETLNDFERKHMMAFYKRLEEMDEYSFNRADYIVFPCPEAEEPYYNNWEKYQHIKSKKEKCYRYVATGIAPKFARVSRSEIRRKYDIEDDDFVLSYAGRHNSVKGYDKLKEYAHILFEKDGKIKVIAAGKEAPLTRLVHPQWIEIGFTKDPHSLIAASDVYMLPNKETYFDLVMIEVLSLGKIVIASRTGGNKFFERNGVDGVLLYDTDEEALELIKKVKAMNPSERERLEKANYDFYIKNLTGEAFFESYCKILKEIEQA